MTDVLPSWNDGSTREAIVQFVDRVNAQGVPAEDRIAVFDNDGTLWCEQPLPIQLDFILRRLAEMASSQTALRERQPWKAVVEHDVGWFRSVMADHYAGDDTHIGELITGIVEAYDGISIEDFEADADSFLRTAQHPTLGRGYLECAFVPMVELLRHLEANGFTNYIASGGGRDFMRPVSQELYGIPREQVIGSSSTFAYVSDGKTGTITHQPEGDYLDDGPEKPVRIWNRTGRRPLLAGGNSNGDIAMLEFTQHADKPTLRLLVVHDDAEREFDYTAGAEQALERAEADGWTVISMKNDWTSVF